MTAGRLTWSYLDYGLKPDGLKMGTPVLKWVHTTTDYLKDSIAFFLSFSLSQQSVATEFVSLHEMNQDGRWGYR